MESPRPADLSVPRRRCHPRRPWPTRRRGGVAEAVDGVGGFPTYGGGPFEQYGVPTTIPLLLAFLALCVVQAVAAVLVWRRRRSGAVLVLVTLPPGLVFWWGFALPIGPPLAVLAAALVILGWPELRR